MYKYTHIYDTGYHTSKLMLHYLQFFSEYAKPVQLKYNLPVGRNGGLFFFCDCQLLTLFQDIMYHKLMFSNMFAHWFYMVRDFDMPSNFLPKLHIDQMSLISQSGSDTVCPCDAINMLLLWRRDHSLVTIYVKLHFPDPLAFRCDHMT